MCPTCHLGEKGVSSANILDSEFATSGKSFMYIININDPKTYPCGTTAKMFSLKKFVNLKQPVAIDFLNNF